MHLTKVLRALRLLAGGNDAIPDIDFERSHFVTVEEEVLYSDRSAMGLHEWQ